MGSLYEVDGSPVEVKGAPAAVAVGAEGEVDAQCHGAAADQAQLVRCADVLVLDVVAQLGPSPFDRVTFAGWNAIPISGETSISASCAVRAAG